jgi:hypothetical protein
VLFGAHVHRAHLGLGEMFQFKGHLVGLSGGGEMVGRAYCANLKQGGNPKPAGSRAPRNWLEGAPLVVFAFGFQICGMRFLWRIKSS